MNMLRLKWQHEHKCVRLVASHTPVDCYSHFKVGDLGVNLRTNSTLIFYSFYMLPKNLGKTLLENIHIRKSCVRF